jgi:hypothetical protein
MTARIPALLLLLLLLSVASYVFGQNSAVVVRVDANAQRHTISPEIYGVAYADSATLADLNCPVLRYGGNNTSRYNWQLNADNRGNDWYYESIGEASSVAGERGDSLIASSVTAGSKSMITIPMIGWVAKLGSNRSKLASFSIAKYGPQTGADWQWFPDAGNGIASNGQPITGNDPNDANVANSPALQTGWINHIVSRWGRADSGGLKYYILDNEPSIWHATHRDVQPTGLTMEQMRDLIVQYGQRVKAADPSASVVAPEEWGWSGYLLSGYDQQWGSRNGWGNLPDRAQHSGWDYMPWLLDQLHKSELSTGQRLLDVFSLHIYPQGGEFSDDVSSAMQLRRNRSTRALWDPAYVDETWIGTQVQLIPRMKSWVASYYPGTRTAITEYNWGAEGHINGATTQADIYGIFGREGLDLAARWATPDPSSPTYKAMKMYRNYDGKKSGFGDISVSTTAPAPDSLSAFGAVRSSDGAMTVMAVSKVLSGTTPVTFQMANFVSAGTAQAWQLTSAGSITRLADIPVSGGQCAATIPAQSITLLVIPPAAGVPACDINMDGNTNVLDVQVLVNTILSGAAATRGDLNKDGRIDVLDLQLLVNVILGKTSCP